MSLLLLFNYPDLGDVDLVKFDDKVYEQTVLKRRETTNFQAVRELSEEPQDVPREPEDRVLSLPETPSHVPFTASELRARGPDPALSDLRFPDVKLPVKEEVREVVEEPPVVDPVDYEALALERELEIIRKNELLRLAKLKEEEDLIIALMLMDEE